MGRLKFTLKAWPVIALATIGLCFFTQQAAKFIGIDLPDQQNVKIVRAILFQSFESKAHFLSSLFLVTQVVLLLPVVEEFIFRYLLLRLPAKFAPALSARLGFVCVSSALFSAAHYITQPFPDAAFIALFFFGIAQCRIYAKTERLWCPMLNHALFNLTNLILALTLPDMG